MPSLISRSVSIAFSELSQPPSVEHVLDQCSGDFSQRLCSAHLQGGSYRTTTAPDKIMSNLPYTTEIMEKEVVPQLLVLLRRNGLFKMFSQVLDLITVLDHLGFRCGFYWTSGLHVII